MLPSFRCPQLDEERNHTLGLKPEVASVAACFRRDIKSEVAIKARIIFPLFSFFKKANKGGKALFNKSRRRKRRRRMTDLISLWVLATIPSLSATKNKISAGIRNKCLKS